MSIDYKWIIIDEERFYYEEANLFHGRKKMDLDIARENLSLFQSIIEKSSVKYGLIFGTLLGAVREQNFIKHDEDIDIYVLLEERDQFLRLLFKFKDLGLQLVRIQSDMLSLMRQNEYIDVYFFRVKYKLGIWKRRVFTNEYEYAAEHFEKPIKQMFLGMNIYIPKNSQKLVRKIYGKNWRIPIADSPSRANTIYKRISRLGSIAKRMPFYNTIETITKKLLEKLGF
jgi:lipopolysaccharide cholinephosphotransferase